MSNLDISQQIKIIREAMITLPIHRTATEPYDPERPTRFDRHVYTETLSVNTVIGSLLNTINNLAKELMVRPPEMPLDRDTWRLLKSIKKLLEEQQMSV